MIIHKNFFWGTAGAALIFVLESPASANDPAPVTIPGEKRGLISGTFHWMDNYFRAMEFREPIVTIPVEARYGIGLYGWERGNPFRFDPALISYEGDSVETIPDIALAGRTGSFLEFQGVQTNLSYLIFGKSYLDILTGLGFRYSSIFPLPVNLGGLPEIPSTWFAEETGDTTRSFSPTLLEGNIVTSLILQWRPRWFVHFQYSYGFNWARFYRDSSVNPDPSGTGRTALYALGIKFIRETETAARYAWGFELRHIYPRVTNIKDPGNDTPISAFDLPSLGIFFTFGAFYGGRSTVGDEGKALFIKKDYVSAARNLTQFVKSYPGHARIGRARKFLKLATERIPYQLVKEGEELERRGELDLALDKLIKARLTADRDLKPRIARIIERAAETYMASAESHYAHRQDELALKALRKAGSISETAKASGRILEAKIHLEQGRDLAYRELYPMALRKYEKAMELAPSLEIEIRRAQLEAATGMLRDVNRASEKGSPDEGSVRLALQSLYKAREILQRSDPEIDRIILGLENQLTRSDRQRVQERIGGYVEQAELAKARRDQPQVAIGMLVAEVEEIMGKPDSVVERFDEANRSSQLWVYDLPDGEKRLLYFMDYVLFRIE